MEHINSFKAAVAALCAALTALWGWFGWVVVAWVGCMLIDYATGSAAALRAGEWSSKSARDGIWHKLGSVVAVIVAAILDTVIGHLLGNVPGVELPFSGAAIHLHGAALPSGGHLVHPHRGRQHYRERRRSGGAYSSLAHQNDRGIGVQSRSGGG